MRRHAIPLGAAIVVAMTACQAATDGAEKPADAPAATGQEEAAPLRDAELPVARLAIDALAAELGIPKDRITVDSVTAVDWPDGSLGCPKPGMGYLTVITPGHRIALRVEGAIHIVHEAKGRAIVCHQSKAMGGVTANRELVFRRQMLAAQQDLTRRLGVPAAEVRPASAEERTWDDAALGCPEAGVEYAAGKVSGWVLTLRLRDRDYTYHTDLTRTIPCPAITAE